jgi:hypothetical protein
MEVRAVAEETVPEGNMTAAPTISAALEAAGSR